VTREEYKRRYIARMVEQSFVTHEEAEDIFECGHPTTGMCAKDTEEALEMGEPEWSADMEMSYWED